MLAAKIYKNKSLHAVSKYICCAKSWFCFSICFVNKKFQFSHTTQKIFNNPMVWRGIAVKLLLTFLGVLHLVPSPWHWEWSLKGQSMLSCEQAQCVWSDLASECDSPAFWVIFLVKITLSPVFTRLLKGLT